MGGEMLTNKNALHKNLTPESFVKDCSTSEWNETSPSSSMLKAGNMFICVTKKMILYCQVRNMK